MIKTHKIGLVVLALVASVVAIPASTVFARQGGAEAETKTATSQTEQQKKDLQTQLEQAKQDAEKKREEAKQLAEKQREEAKNLAEQKREQAKQAAETALEQKKTEIKSKTEEQKKQACESVTGSLNNKLSGGVSKSTNLKSVFDKHLSNIQDFYTKKNLKVANYDTLLAGAQAAGASAQASIDALKSFTPKVDCSNVGATTANVAGYKEAINKVRADLNTYRTAIKNLLSPIKQAAEATKTEGQQ